MLDRAEEIREQYGRVVRERPEGTTPAAAVRLLVQEDIDRYRRLDLRIARGAFAALCVESAVLRRFALEFRDRQAETVTEAILDTDPGIHPFVARGHAAALISVVQAVTDRIGRSVLDRRVLDVLADEMQQDADVAFDALDRYFLTLPSGLRRGT